MRFLGPTRRLLKNSNVLLHPNHSTRYNKYIHLMSPNPNTDLPSSSIPQTRVLLPESEAGEPAHKKLRLDGDSHDDVVVVGREADMDSGMEDVMIASTSQPTNDNIKLKLKKKKKKKREAPLPELCSAPDVLYQEIRMMLGEDIVDGITSEGGAFNSPYSGGDEIEVTIDRMSAGGKFFFCFFLGFSLNCGLFILYQVLVSV